MVITENQMRGEQGHFRGSMECAAQVFSLEIVVKNILRGVKTSVSFICLENAHDGVDCNAVWIIMGEYRMHCHLAEVKSL